MAAGLLAVVTAALLVAGCAGTPARKASSEVRRSIVQLALSMVGVPYRYGGADPSEGFDCSGLVHYTYASNGQAVPRSSQSQFEAARKVSLEEAAEGDLLFFRDQDKLSHVAIYLGDGRFVHAPSSGKSVSVASVDETYYQEYLVAVGRLLP